jgi:hypothetical protein
LSVVAPPWSIWWRMFPCVPPLRHLVCHSLRLSRLCLLSTLFLCSRSPWKAPTHPRRCQAPAATWVWHQLCTPPPSKKRPLGLSPVRLPCESAYASSSPSQMEGVSFKVPLRVRTHPVRRSRNRARRRRERRDEHVGYTSLNYVLRTPSRDTPFTQHGGTPTSV